MGFRRLRRVCLAVTVAVVASSCAAYSWGDNSQGQLGLGFEGGEANLATQEISASTWVSMDAGRYHSCGIKADNTLWCWGANWSGQLGVGDTENRSSPVQVGQEAGWNLVTAGRANTCGIRAGELYCWGWDRFGVLGQGTVNEGSSVPLRVGSAADWVDVETDASSSHVCGIREGEALYCWGANGHGQVGIGDTDTRSVPTRIGGQWSKIATGRLHTCALDASRTLYCWGDNSSGQLDATYPSSGSLSPVTIHSYVSSSWELLDAGQNNTCGMTTPSESLLCWGEKRSVLGPQWGICALGFLCRVTTPSTVGGVVTALSVGGATISSGVDSVHACAVVANSDLYCWGDNGSGQLGGEPSASGALVSSSLSGWVDVTAGGLHTIGLRNEN